MSDYRLRDVMQRLADQGGAATRTQLADELGVPRSTIADWIARGVLSIDGDRVVRSAAVPDSRRLALATAMLEVGQESILSHQTAVRVWGVWGWSEGEPIHLVVHRRAKHVPTGVVLHHTRRLPATDRTELDGLAVTTFARAVCDVAGRVRRATVADLLADGASRGLLDLVALERCVRERKRFPGRTAVREAMLAFDDEQAKFLSKLERRSYAALVAAGLTAPRVNHPIVLEGRPRLLDHAWPGLRYAVEIDGPHHRRPSQREDDERRDRALATAGWIVDRFPIEVVAADGHVATVAARLRELQRSAP